MFPWTCHRLNEISLISSLNINITPTTLCTQKEILSKHRLVYKVSEFRNTGSQRGKGKRHCFYLQIVVNSGSLRKIPYFSLAHWCRNTSPHSSALTERAKEVEEFRPLSHHIPNGFPGKGMHSYFYREIHSLQMDTVRFTSKNTNSQLMCRGMCWYLAFHMYFSHVIFQQ